MDYTKIILSILTNKRGVNTKLLNKITEDKYPNIYNYIMDIYPDSSSLHETLKRLPLHIDIKPVCPICGKPVAYIGKTKQLFGTYCSNSCRAKDPKNYSKWQEGQKKYNLEHYGVEYNFQRKDVMEKRKETFNYKYGTTNLYDISEIKEKIKNTCIKRYGGISPMCSLDIIKKRTNTFLQKYGVSHPLKSKTVQEKIQQTNMQKYGFKNAAQNNEIREKIKKTYLAHYGVDNYFKSDDYIFNKVEYNIKAYNTKKIHHTFNTSKPESDSYKLLQQVFPLTEYQYTSDLYPFNCDFYIPEIDTYIECNYHWTHGGHAYIKENDKKQLNEWIEKSQTSNFYKNAIQTWTVRDVKKRNVAKQNNLNYIEFWNIDELKTWITQLNN